MSPNLWRHFFRVNSNRYEGNKHGKQGYFVLLVAAALSTLDFIALVSRLVGYTKAIRAGQELFTCRGAWDIVVLDREARTPASAAEYTNLVVADPEEYDAAELKAREIEDEDEPEPIHVRRAHFIEPIAISADHIETAQWANNVQPEVSPRSAASDRTFFGPQSPRGSQHSDDTLQEPSQWISPRKTSLLKRIGRGVFATVERILVFAGYLQVITGIVDYTGGCRAGYVNICLAHLISACSSLFCVCSY